MADNTTITAQAGGDVIRDKDRAGVKTQIVALDLNPAGAETLMAGTLPVDDADTQVALASILAKLTADPATQATLAAVLAKLTSDPSTATLQGTANTKLDTIATSLTTIDGHVDGLEGFTDGIEGKLDTLHTDAGTLATQTTLAAVLTALSDGTMRTKHQPLASATLANVASSASSVTLQASNASRRSWSVFNDSTAVLYVKFGATASATSYTVQIAAGGYYEMPLPAYAGVIDGIWASANGNARVTEGA